MSATETGTIIPLDTERVVAQLKRDEGFNPHPYKDSEGVLTIGYGFNLEADGMTQDEAVTILHIRTWNRYLQLITALPWVHKLDQQRQGVLLNMAYNMGVAGLLAFKHMLEALQSGAFDVAADEMLNSKWSTQVGARAHRLAQQMRTGLWQ